MLQPFEIGNPAGVRFYELLPIDFRKAIHPMSVREWKSDWGYQIKNPSFMPGFLFVVLSPLNSASEAAGPNLKSPRLIGKHYRSKLFI